VQQAYSTGRWHKPGMPPPLALACLPSLPQPQDLHACCCMPPSHARQPYPPPPSTHRPPKHRRTWQCCCRLAHAASSSSSAPSPPTRAPACALLPAALTRAATCWAALRQRSSSGVLQVLRAGGRRQWQRTNGSGLGVERWGGAAERQWSARGGDRLAGCNAPRASTQRAHRASTLTAQ